MSAPLLGRATTYAVLTAVAVTSLSVAPAAAGSPDAPRRGNPTGAAAGSRANGSAYLKLSLVTTADGRIRVSWKRPAPTARLKKFVVRVGMNRLLDARVHHYDVRRSRQSVVVPQAFGATPASGNFSFVKITVVRRDGSRGSSPTKWIQAPIAAACPAGTDLATVGSFNVRSWNVDRRGGNPRFDWRQRGPRVVQELLRSGAHAVAIQEASGQRGLGYGGLRQSQWLLSRLNASDPDPGARWVDAMPQDSYSGGLVGTRVFYDASKYRRLASGFARLRVARTPNAYAPWVRLRAVDGVSAPFVMISTHLTAGDGRRAAVARNEQSRQVIALARRLRQSFGGQVVLGGDLNSTVNTKPYNTAQQALLRAGFYDAFATDRLVNSRYGTTNSFDFPIRSTPYRRDYILTLGDAQGSCRYVNRAYRTASRVASDHFMQVATVPL